MCSAEVSHSFVPESNIPSGVHLSIRMSRWDRVYSPLWCAGDVGRGTNTLQTRKAAEMQGNDLGSSTTNSATQRNNHSCPPLLDYIYFGFEFVVWRHQNMVYFLNLNYFFILVYYPDLQTHNVFVGLDNKLYNMSGTYIKIAEVRFFKNICDFSTMDNTR